VVTRPPRCLALLLAALLGLPLPAAAQTGPAGQTGDDPRPREAKAACAAGEIQKGVRLLADLYADTEDLTWVYNQGRCYQQNGWADEAIERFQEYLRRATDITPAERAEVEKFIAELEARRQRREPDIQTLTPPPMPAGPVAVQAPLPPAPDPLDRRLTIGAITLGGVGLAGLVGGLIFGARVNSLEDEVESWNTRGEGQVPSAEYRDREQSAHRNNVAQWVSYSVGALALAGSGACLYLKLRRRQGEPSVALAPTLLPGGGGGQLRLRF
jgi:hypothetical protein